MSFEVFKEKVDNLVKQAGGLHARYSTEDGRHYARISDGTTIIGNSGSLRVTIRWNGRNHQAVAEI